MHFENAGFQVLDEAFTDMRPSALHPQSLTMETQWVSSWFQRLLEVKHANKSKSDSKRPALYICDRSPFSAVFYSRHGRGKTLDPLISALTEELREEAGIEIVTTHVDVEPELLWGRITARLEVEPDRARFNEGSRAWMDSVQAFYRSRAWDQTVKNDSEGRDAIGCLLRQIADLVAERPGLAAYGAEMDRLLRLVGLEAALAPGQKPRSARPPRLRHPPRCVRTPLCSGLTCGLCRSGSPPAETPTSPMWRTIP